MAMAGNYKVVPTKLPYIHPTQRHLKSDQIGPSSHKNEYSLGVLQGNWVEEVAAFEKNLADVPMENTTVMRASYRSPGAMEQTKSHNRPELDRGILFGHGKDYQQKSFVTTNQLMYADPSSGNSVNSEAALKLTGYRGIQERALKKREQWQADMAPNQFETTKSTTIDATARTVQDGDVEFLPHHASKWGDSVSSLSQDFHKSGLRKPVPLYRTPLVMPRK